MFHVVPDPLGSSRDWISVQTGSTMNKPLPWNVKGVGFDAREAARLAAKRAGVPLGEWLNEIISSRAAELGVQVDDVEAEDRLEAIAARLSESGDTAPLSRDSVTATRTSADHLPVQFKRDSVLPSPTQVGATRKVAAAPGFEPELAMATAAASSMAAFGRAAPASAHFATAPEPAEAVTTTMAGFSSGPGDRRRAGPTRIKPATTVNADAERLDERLNTILAKLNRSFEAAAEIGEAFERGTERAPSADKTAPTAEAAPTAVERRPETSSIPPRQDQTQDAEVPARLRAPPSGTASRADEFSDLHAAFKTLAEKLESQLNAPGGRSPERTRSEGAIGPKRSADLPAARLDAEERGRNTEIPGMQRELAQLATHVADMTPQRSLAALESAVRELGGRMDLLRLDGVQGSLLAPVERLGKDMRDAIRSTDATAAVEGVRRDMKALAAKLDAQPARGPDNRTIEGMRGELRTLGEAVASLDERMSASGRLEDEVSALGERIGMLAERTTPAVSRDLAQAIGDIRKLLQAFDPGAGLGALDQKIDHISARIDSMAGSRGPDAYFSDVMRQIDRAHETLVDRIAGREPASADLSGIEESLGTLSAKIDSMGRASHDVNALYGLVGNLADRMQDARDPQADGQAFAALQMQIGKLVERLDRSEGDNATLRGLERLIGDLFLQIEQSRNAAIDAAENAARAAAQDTLRAAMDNPSLNGAELTVQTGLDVDHVSQELADLRRVQEASDRRITGTLTALNTTLERLVDHMVATLPPAPPVEEAAMAEKAARRRRRAAPDPQPAETRGLGDVPPFDPEQFLLEPGSLGPVAQTPSRAQRAGAAPAVPIPQVGGEGAGSVAPLIAAARRAAQAAQDSALEASLKPAAGPGETSAGGQPGKVRSFFANRRRPLLLALAGVVLLLGTLQIVRLSATQDGGDTAPRAPAVSDAPAAKTDKGAALSTAPAVQEAAAAPAPQNSLLTDPTPTGSVSPAAPAPTPDVAALTGVNQGLKDLAASGNAPAQFEIAVRLSDGKGVTRDVKAAVNWFERAAKQGLAPAQYRLGSIYEKGVGVTADPALAVAWYEKAAGQGNIRAMHNLAVMSAEGAGAKPDYGKAVTWFTKAASYGVRDSQYNLAVLCARGLGVPQNLGQSYAWFALAAQQGDTDAVAKRDTIAAKLDAKALADAKANVASFKALTADPAANDVTPPPGGWDAATPGKTAAARKVDARISSM